MSVTASRVMVSACRGINQGSRVENAAVVLAHGQGRPHLAMSKAGENVEEVRLGEERCYKAEETGRDVLPR